jgi:hypothetical protein
LQLVTLWEARTLEPPVAVVCALVLAQTTTNHRPNAAPHADAKQDFLIISDRYP